MKQTIRSTWQRFGAALFSLSTAAVAVAADSASVSLPLQNTGADTNASGSVTMALGSRSSVLTVRAMNLTPGSNYVFTVGGIGELTKAADARGGWFASFRTGARPGTPALDFDPRGQVIALNDGTANVLQALVARPGEPAGSRQSERVELRGESGSGRAMLLNQVLPNGRRMFTCLLSRVTGTNWSLYVDGIHRGAINVRNGSGNVMFDSVVTNASRRRLDFDPRGEVIDIAQDTNLVFSAKAEAVCNGVNSATPSVQTTFIPSTGVDPNGTARARLRLDPDARRKFSIEIEDVPVGTYEFSAASSNGVAQFTVNVVSTLNGTEGELEFSSREDNGDELPLTFDPRISTFTVQRGGVVYFQGALTFGTVSGSNEPPALIEENLTSKGLDGDASGDAKYEIRDTGRRDFSVEIEDVNVGVYQLWVGGTLRGNISAQLKNGQVRGELEFANPAEPGKLLLNFDPRGQLIEVKTVAGTFFSHLFGGSATGGGNGGAGVSLVPIRFELPLFSTGAAPAATARMEFKRDDRGRRNFEIEIEDAPLGAYTLLVAGVQRGSVNVITDPNGTRGQIEFDDEPEAGELPLSFDPLGQWLELVRDGQTYFARELPTAN